MAGAPAFDIRVECADPALRQLVERFNSLRRYRAVSDLDDFELTRLMALWGAGSLVSFAVNRQHIVSAAQLLVSSPAVNDEQLMALLQVVAAVAGDDTQIVDQRVHVELPE